MMRLNMRGCRFKKIRGSIALRREARSRIVPIMSELAEQRVRNSAREGEGWVRFCGRQSWIVRTRYLRSCLRSVLLLPTKTSSKPTVKILARWSRKGA